MQSKTRPRNTSWNKVTGSTSSFILLLAPILSMWTFTRQKESSFKRWANDSQFLVACSPSVSFQKLRLKSDLKVLARNKLAEIKHDVLTRTASKSDEITFVGVHARRTDFIRSVKLKELSPTGPIDDPGKAFIHLDDQLCTLHMKDIYWYHSTIKHGKCLINDFPKPIHAFHKKPSQGSTTSLLQFAELCISVATANLYQLSTSSWLWSRWGKGLDWTRRFLCGLLMIPVGCSATSAIGMTASCSIAQSTRIWRLWCLVTTLSSRKLSELRTH